MGARIMSTRCAGNNMTLKWWNGQLINTNQYLRIAKNQTSLIQNEIYRKI